MKILPAVLLVVLVWAAIYLPGLGTHELKGEEARRVLPGRTMLQTGDWIIPRSAGKVYNRKPPGINWATAAAIKLTGRMDEWTVRMPSVLAMLALALVMLTALRGFLGCDGALLAALFVLTNISFIEKGRLAEIEGLYCSLFGIAIVSWLALWWREKRAAAWIVSGLVLGLGFLVKGPLHVWYFYALVVAVLVQERKLAALRYWQHVVGLVLFFATWTWWTLLNSAANPQKDSGAVWMEQVTDRLGFREFDFVNWLLQIPQSLANFLPWVLLLPLAFRPGAADWAEDEDRSAAIFRGLRRGLVIAFLVIAILPSSRPRFMMPLNAVAAVLVAMALVRQSIDWQRKCRPWIIGIIVAMMIALPAYAWMLNRKMFGSERLRPFAAEIIRHTGADPEIVLFRTPERMWPFYLGLGCREIFYQKELPRSARWIMTPANDRDENLAILEPRYGGPVAEIKLKEPVTGDAGGKGDEFVLWEFTPGHAP